MKIYFDSNRGAVVMEGMGYYLPNTLEAVATGGRVDIRQADSALSELLVSASVVQDAAGLPAGASIGEVIDYLNAEFAKGSASGGGNLPEVATDPVTPAIGQQWIQRRVIHPAGTLSAFVGGYPVVLLTDQNAFSLSIQTSEGVKRLELG